MAEFHIWLQYISKQHMAAENAFLLKIFDQYAARTQIFLTRHEVNREGGPEGVPAHPKIWPKWRLWDKQQKENPAKNESEIQGRIQNTRSDMKKKILKTAVHKLKLSGILILISWFLR